MPSDLNISSPPGFASGPSYRPQVRGRGAGSTRVLLAGAGAAALLAVGVASWGLTGGEAPIPPVIEADPRPLRVKPENAGGLQVAGTEEQAANPAVGRRDEDGRAAIVQRLGLGHADGGDPATIGRERRMIRPAARGQQLARLGLDIVHVDGPDRRARH